MEKIRWMPRDSHRTRFDGMVNWRWLPVCRILIPPVTLETRITSLTFTGPVYLLARLHLPARYFCTAAVVVHAVPPEFV